MATVRLTTKEVQVDSTIYMFDAVWKADGFEACLAAADADHCRLEHRPVQVRQAEDDAASTEDAAALDSEEEEA